MEEQNQLKAEIFDQWNVENCFNKFPPPIGPKLASTLPELQTKFDHYLNVHQTFMGKVNLTDDKVKEALRSLKAYKSPGYDNISSNVANETSDILFTQLKYTFNVSLQQEIFQKT